MESELSEADVIGPNNDSARFYPKETTSDVHKGNGVYNSIIHNNEKIGCDLMS